MSWEEVRKHKWADADPPPEWPDGIRAISMKGLALFGLDEAGQLYWDGNRVLVRRRVTLGWFERVLATAAALAAVASAAADWWPILFR
jgi:hypothetical protein